MDYRLADRVEVHSHYEPRVGIFAAVAPSPTTGAAPYAGDDDGDSADASPVLIAYTAQV